MKLRFTFVLLGLLISSMMVSAQTGSDEFQSMLNKPEKDILFGKDIIINDQPDQNQKDIAICSAFNGWMFAVVTRNTGGHAAYSLYRSTDNGIEWEVISDEQFVGIDRCLHNINVIACGTSLSNLKVYFSFINSDTLDLFYNSIIVDRFNGVTGMWEDILFSESENNVKQNDVIIASDFLSPGIGSDLYSIGILFSQHNRNTNRDSVIFCSSSNGGMSMNNRKGIAAASSRHLGKVSLAYGYSPSMNSGKYFAAWENKDNVSQSYGHIYTSHTEPGISGSFTSPVCLDCGDATIDNKCRYPSIACQYNNIDNDSANITSVTLFQKQTTEANNDIMGFYNLQAATTSSFHKMDIAVTSHNEIQPNITFNHFDNSFYMTYYDSTAQKLPSVSKNYNFINPNNWTVVSTGYNDLNNLAAPFPKVIINENQQQAAYVWNAERATGNGMGMFDAEYSTYTGISVNNGSGNADIYRIYPNPCSTTASIEFELTRNENVSVKLINPWGEVSSAIDDQNYTKGKHIVRFDVGSLQPGTYISSVSIGQFPYYGKIVIIH